MISFERLGQGDLELVFSWLEKAHVREFWDTTQAHRDDILNFVAGRKTPSEYFGGGYSYWLARWEGEPYALLMSIEGEVEGLWSLGHCYSIDFMIGNERFLGKGYGAQTLEAFVERLREEDERADTFFIDPLSSNERAVHVFKRAGFELAKEFVREEGTVSVGQVHQLLVKRFSPKVRIESTSDQGLITELAGEYFEALSEACGESVVGGGFETYFKEVGRKAFLIRVYGELAGFILIHPHMIEKGDWSLSEFFVRKKFQGWGVGKAAAQQLWEELGGQWEVAVLPKNKAALAFWEKVVGAQAEFVRKEVEVDFDKDEKRVLFSFRSL